MMRVRILQLLTVAFSSSGSLFHCWAAPNTILDSQTSAETIVSNLQSSSSRLTTAEVNFFNDVWLKSFNNIIQSIQPNAKAAKDPKFKITKVRIVKDSMIPLQNEDVKKKSNATQRDGVRLLKKGRRIYDARVLIDWRCRLCWDYRRDRRGLLSQTDSNATTNQAQLKGSRIHETPAGILDQESHKKLEETFCASLRGGTFPAFQQVDNCQISFR